MSGSGTTPAAGPARRVRAAVPADVGDVDRLVRELATTANAPDAVVATPADLATALFGPDPLVHCLVAELDTPGADPVVAGIAVWFVSFSTWRGRHGIWLEDLVVDPAHRGLGLGRALLRALAAQAVVRGYERVEWSVLDANTRALGFYRRLGARALDDATVHRLAGTALHELAGEAAQDGRDP